MLPAVPASQSRQALPSECRETLRQELEGTTLHCKFVVRVAEDVDMLVVAEAIAAVQLLGGVSADIVVAVLPIAAKLLAGKAEIAVQAR